MKTSIPGNMGNGNEDDDVTNPVHHNHTNDNRSNLPANHANALSAETKTTGELVSETKH